MNENETYRQKTVDASQGQEPDAHGYAALLLVESLIHMLIERSTISVLDALETVEVAEDVSREFMADREDQASSIADTAVLLAAIGDSLRSDLARGHATER